MIAFLLTIALLIAFGSIVGHWLRRQRQRADAYDRFYGRRSRHRAGWTP